VVRTVAPLFRSTRPPTRAADARVRASARRPTLSLCCSSTRDSRDQGAIGSHRFALDVCAMMRARARTWGVRVRVSGIGQLRVEFLLRERRLCCVVVVVSGREESLVVVVVVVVVKRVSGCRAWRRAMKRGRWCCWLKPSLRPSSLKESLFLARADCSIAQSQPIDPTSQRAIVTLHPHHPYHHRLTTTHRFLFMVRGGCSPLLPLSFAPATNPLEARATHSAINPDDPCRRTCRLGLPPRLEVASSARTKGTFSFHLPPVLSPLQARLVFSSPNAPHTQER
jgi:hypothetical protein